MKYDVTKGGYILLGRCGENLARTVEIDVSEYLVEYPGAVVTLLHRRHGESGIYPVAAELRDGCLVWQPTSADTAIAGSGEAEVRVTVDGVLAKSKILSTMVDKSLTGQETEAPEPGMEWVDKITTVIGSVQNMKAEAESVAYGEPASAEYDGKTGTMHFGIPEGRPGRDGTDGAAGAKGDKGDPGGQGPKGDPGSDASVTAENIEAALGYAPVKDVQVAGTSVLANGVANVSVAETWVTGAKHPGVSAPSISHGLYISDGLIKIYPAEADNIERRVLDRPITPTNLDKAVKAAMCDGKGAVWTAAERKAARERMCALGFDDESTSINLYDPSLQTDDTIAPHYYVSGVPYSSTNYDTMWNCTAPIPVKPNTMYTVGLVPAYHYVYGSEDIMIEKPWSHAGNGCFFYDADGKYIKGTGEANTFTTPANCASIRFNYIIGKKISLAELNARCMLVEGNTLPTTYEPYSTTNSMTVIVDMLSKSGLSHYEYNNNVLTVYQNGTKTVFGYSGNNNIMMCKGYGLVDAFVPFTTDILSPMIITASQNADGDLDDTYRLTGGNHSYGQTSGTPSANTVLVEVFADDKPAEESGLFNTLTLHARHEVQAWNTEKADGTGRAVLVEDDYITWDGKRMNAEIHLTPTENVVISEYYGLQLAEINSCNVYGGKVKKNIATGGYSDEVPYFIEGICNGFRIRMHLDETGLGKYTYNTSAIKYSKNDYKKAYFRPIGESHSFTAEDCLWLRGYFEIIAL